MSYKWLNEITFLTVNFLVFAVLSHKKGFLQTAPKGNVYCLLAYKIQ